MNGGTDKDFYLSQFVILTLLAEFYDGQGASAQTRDYIRVGELQNCVADRLKNGVENTSDEEEEKNGLAFRNMQEDEMIKTTKKLDNLMDWNLLNQNNFQRIQKIMQKEILPL